MRRVVVQALRDKEENWTAWTASEHLSVGVKLIELLTDSTRVADIISRRARGRMFYVVQLTETFTTWLNSIDDKLSLLQPDHLPCVIPPKDWTSPYEGGYHTGALLNPPTLCKTRSKTHEQMLKTADLSLVYRGVNAIQSTPWQINPEVLSVMETIIQNRLDLPVLPAMDPAEIPERPLDIPAKAGKGEATTILTEDQANRLAIWKTSARDTYTANEQLASRRLQALKVAALAAEFKGFDAIYFPHQLDFRGRVYAIPQVLNPQGPDFAKGLLRFSEGQPLDTDRAQGWFLIHGANTYGNDKVRFDERIDWTLTHDADILACAADPLGNVWWTEADSPFCFLAWCLEYAQWTQQTALGLGDRFLSKIPISLDGTCNGLQHYSAMLRDPIGGAATNLLPAEKPQDIYAEVAKVVETKLKRMGLDEENYATRWLSVGIDRSITKRAVMVLPYGGTIRSCHDYVYAAAAEKVSSGKIRDPFGDELKTASAFLANIVWESIGDVVVAARAAMGWLMDTTRVATNNGHPVSWFAPSGFPVHMAYPKMKDCRVETKLCGSMVRVTLSEEIEGSLDKRRQASAIAPNFVHSLDAAALILTANLALDNGVTNFAMIHDSYGTSAGSTDMLAACTRHAFVDMYSEHDPLAAFLASVNTTLPLEQQVTSTPTAGGLDLQEVLNSPFFFA